MSALRRRLEKIEAGRREIRVIFVPDHVRGAERAACIEDYRRENCLSSGDRIIAVDESDRGA